MISMLIASKDRPLFLDAYLSTITQVEGLNISVLYKISSPEYSYDRLIEKYDVEWIPETELFRHHVCKWIYSVRDEYVMITPDDNVYRHTHDTWPSTVVRILDTCPDIFSYSLRLDKDVVKCHAGKGKLSVYNQVCFTIFYDYRNASGLWRNTFDCSGAVYRKDAIVRLTNAMPVIGTINDIETVGSEYYKPTLMAFADYPAIITNIHVDAWRNDQLKLVTNRVTDSMAMELYNQGKRIDIDRMFEERDRENTTHVMELFLK